MRRGIGLDKKTRLKGQLKAGLVFWQGFRKWII